eukprot:119578-Hanusia_phi.AAC.2
MPPHCSESSAAFGVPVAHSDAGYRPGLAAARPRDCGTVRGRILSNCQRLADFKSTLGRLAFSVPAATRVRDGIGSDTVLTWSARSTAAGDPGPGGAAGAAGARGPPIGLGSFTLFQRGLLSH